METEVRQLVRAVHDSPGRLVLVAAGAGTQALAWLLGVAGASRSLLEARIPYDEAAFTDFLGQPPQQFVAASTAGLLAGTALSRACQLHRGDEPLVGLACTATIVTDRPKRGPHRAHVAMWTAGRVAKHSLHLHKGKRDRQGEEELVSRLIMNTLAEAYLLPHRLVLPLGDGDMHVTENTDLAQGVARLLNGEDHCFGIYSDGAPLEASDVPPVILSGAFNPLHEGHLGLARVAEEITGRPVAFELAAANADKPSLSRDETLRRMMQFAGQHAVLASDAPLFTQKADLFPGATFVLGFDTARRVLQRRFYDDSEEKMLAALSQIRDRGCRFLVAGRVDGQGVFHQASELEIPVSFPELFQFIPASRFRRDISSTELRARAAGHS